MELSALEYSPDGLTIVAACGKKGDLNLMVFDTKSGRKLHEADFAESDSETTNPDIMDTLQILSFPQMAI